MEYPYLYEGTGRPGDYSVYIVGSKDDLPDTYNYRHVYVTDINPKDLRHRTMFNMGHDGSWQSYLILGSNIVRYFKEVERIVDEATESGFIDIDAVISKRHEVAGLYIVQTQEAETAIVTKMPTPEVERGAATAAELLPTITAEVEENGSTQLIAAIQSYPWGSDDVNKLLEWSNAHSPVVGPRVVADIHRILEVVGFTRTEFARAPAPEIKIVEKDPYVNLTTTQHLCRLVDRLVLETEALGRVLIKEEEADFKIATQRTIEEKVSELNKLIDFLDENLEHTYYKYKHITGLLRKHDSKEFFIIDPWHRNFNMSTGQFQHVLRERHKSQTVNFYVDREKLAQDYDVKA